MPSGDRNSGALSDPVAERTSMRTVTVTSSPPSDAVKSKNHSPTSAACGVHWNTP